MSVAVAANGSGTFVKVKGMADQSLIVLLIILFQIAPLVLVGAGAFVYDLLKRHKMRVGVNYRCGQCGFVFPVESALVSGYESHRYGLHIHCSQCGSIVVQHLNPKKEKKTPTYLDPIFHSLSKN